MPNFLAKIQRISTPTPMNDLAGDNSLILVVGHLGRDPETKYTADGKPYTKGTLAVSWGKKGQDQQTEWVNWVAWERQAEAMQQFNKGDAVLLIGKLHSREYNGKTYTDLSVWSVANPVYRTEHDKLQVAKPEPMPAGGYSSKDYEIPF